jgi:NADH-quinone oxidoreductase subunit M
VARYDHWPLLSLVTFLPLIGAAFIMLARGDEYVVARNARNIALSTSLIVFALSLLLWIGFDPNAAGFQFVERADWISIGGSRSIITWALTASRCSSCCCRLC